MKCVFDPYFIENIYAYLGGPADGVSFGSTLSIVVDVCETEPCWAWIA